MQQGRLFFAAFMLVVLCLLLYLFKSFLLVISIGCLMAVATSNINVYFLKLTKGNKLLASSLTTILVSSFLILPFLYALIQIGIMLKNFDYSTITNTINYIKNYHFDLPESMNFIEPKIREFLSSIDLNSITRNIFTYISNFTKTGVHVVSDIALICVFYFFANLYGTQLLLYIKSIVPIDKKELGEVLSEVANVMSVVLYSMILAAILQGLLFSFVIVFFGYDPVLWGILFAISSMIPVVGGALIYVPLSIYEFASNNLYAALWILLYSMVVISFLADNFVKPLIIKWINEKLVKKPTKINELLIFLAILAGISSFGFWGIILGPAILTFFISTIKMYVILKEKNLV
ncbi:acid membrane antigen A [Campylobacter avium LMG 24591]|uniref:Acid membrane antigen A n=1 Tax=Campylobacter avium LMG 24591 TaxID=522484 RepID=A0A222MZ03_9BACT|nr:AI-2E family transporter [Campylobacter avium]ASQ31223.1 acid membrane antigen A [Campylobacter avium LMG 24591]OYD79897.1 acid membrane antigen A [Campylobacter avium]